MNRYDLQSAAFPRFTPEQVDEIGQCHLMKHCEFTAGTRLWNVGDRDVDFFILKSGAVEIVDEGGPEPKRVTLHEAGGFTGEVAQLTGSPALVAGIAIETAQVLEVTPDALRQLIAHHPDLGDLILQAFIARRQLLRDSPDFSGLRVVGSRTSRDAFRIRDFLSKNHYPHIWLDVDLNPDVADLLQNFSVKSADMPVVIWGADKILRNPSNRELADLLGTRRPLKADTYDLVIVGAGPAGLAAAVYGASEGLQTLVLERVGPGGQAGRSMRIENYLGFPSGISGGDLSELAVLQASRFGAELTIPSVAVSLRIEEGRPRIQIDDETTITSKCLLIATGADYRLLAAKGCERFEGCGIYYAATPIEAQYCRGGEIIVVGGGNSAGQAAIFLSNHASKVYLVIRGDDLRKSMSSYLAERVESSENIEILRNTEVAGVAGEERVEEVELVNRGDGSTRVMRVAALFSFIGATPRTEWLPAEIVKDSKNFVCTGPSLAKLRQWEFERDPFLLETSHRGIFAAGDVRSGSVKRVASAVGEGAMAVQFVHECLREMG